MINKKQAEAIIELLAQRKKTTDTFDSHDFIDLYRAHFEHEYISMLSENDSNTNKAFQLTNSKISKFLNHHSSDLNIEKISTTNSTNDHGNESSNAKWKLLPNILKSIIVIIVCLFTTFSSSNGFAQSKFDMPTFKNSVKYIADTLYIQKDIILLNDFIDQGCKKNNPLYFKLEHFFDCRDIKVSKADVKASAVIWMSYMQNILNITKDGLLFEPEEINPNISEVKYNQDSVSSPYSKTKILYESQGYVDYIFPLKKTIKTEPIIWMNLSDDEKNEFYERDRDSLEIGYEWVNQNDMTHINLSYPYQVEYYKYDNYPNYAIKTYSKTDDGENVCIIYDLQGKLLRVHSFDDDMKQEIDMAQNLTYWQDFKNNKYNINSEDTLTVKYVEMILNGDMEKLGAKYIGQMLGIALAGTIASSVSSSYSEDRKIKSNILKKSIQTSSDILNSIDATKMEKARNYVDQLRSDHDGEFYKGHCIRIDDKSFFYSLIDRNGKANKVFKIEYTQKEPFKYNKNISVVK